MRYQIIQGLVNDASGFALLDFIIPLNRIFFLGGNGCCLYFNFLSVHIELSL